MEIRIQTLMSVTVAVTVTLAAQMAVAGNPSSTAGLVEHCGSTAASARGGSSMVSPANDVALSQTVFNTDFVSAGVGGLRNVGSGDITLAGVSGTVTKALLYWNGPTNSIDPTANAAITVNGNGFVGTNIGFTHDNCWDFDNTQAYVVDVTTLVQGTGNGVYAITGLGADLADVVGGRNTNGASLIVFFDDGNGTNNRDVVVFHGNDSNIQNVFDADGWNVSLSGINYTAGTANLQLHVADGQDLEGTGGDEAALVLNGSDLEPQGPIFSGNTVPSANNGPNDNGSLWDIRAWDVTSYMVVGPNTLTMTMGDFSDCVGLVVALIDLPAGAAPGVCDSLCGYVYDCQCAAKNGCDVDGVTVELWASYPAGSPLATTTTTLGRFCFDVDPGVEYDIRFWKKGYCTDTVSNWSCEDGFLSFCLEPLKFVLPESPIFHDYYSTNATFEGYLILPGDVIYACDSNGIIVGLAYVDLPGTYLIHVLGNVPKDVDTLDEGADPGEKVSLWLNCKCPVIVNEGFQNFGNTLFDAAWDCRPTGICCELCEGWNMFSYNVYLNDYSRTNVLATIDLNYDAVRSGRCAVDGPNPVISWFAGRPVNDLTEVEPWYGYDIHMTAADTLCLEGSIIPADTEIPLCEGWNYIPYYPLEADSRVHALASIAGHYTNIYNLWCDEFDSYNVTRPDGANDLFCLYPCRGYWIKMSVADTLVYPTDGYDCNEPIAKVVPSYNSGQVKGSPVSADFWSATDASSSGLRSGDIITVLTESGLLVGEAQVGEHGMFLLHVFGDVSQTATVEGAQPGERLTFQVNGYAASVEGNVSFNERESSQITVRASGANPVPNDYALLQNYPNPFNAGTVIPFTMKDASEWTLTVYNIMGQTVQSFAGFDAPGTVRVSWNGLDQNGGTVPSGVYFYRVTTASWSATKKMTLLK